MKLRVCTLVMCAGLLVPSAVSPQNAELEITQGTLNRLVRRLGALSDGGVYHNVPKVFVEFSPAAFEDCSFWGFLACPALPLRELGFERPGIPLALCKAAGPGPGVAGLIPINPSVTWQWWVISPFFSLKSGSMSFTATVRTRVGEETSTVTRTVPASVSFNPSTHRLRITVGAFTVPLQTQGPEAVKTITEVDVAKLYSISIPIEPQELSIPKPAGGSTTVTARAKSIAPQFLSGRIRVKINMEF